MEFIWSLITIIEASKDVLRDHLDSIFGKRNTFKLIQKATSNKEEQLVPSPSKIIIDVFQGWCGNFRDES